MSVSFTFNNGLVTFIAKGTAYQVRDGEPQFKEVLQLLKQQNNEDALVKLMEKPVVQVAPKAAAQAGQYGRVTLENGRVLVDGKEVHNVVATRITEFLAKGLPTDPLLRFLEKIQQNPSYTAQNELYDFLENKNLPIHEDGDFLAYKAVREDWFDIYSGTINNSVGSVVLMTRASVDDNRSRHCSNGLHVGAMDYVTSYGGDSSRVVIVKVNPRDAVSVPSDYSFMKLRVCRYEVVEEYKGDLIQPTYNEQLYDDERYDSDDERARISSYVDEWLDDDDSFDEGEVQSSGGCGNCGYHNKRDSSGRFCK